MASAVATYDAEPLHPRTIEELHAGTQNLANMDSYRPPSDRHPWLGHPFEYWGWGADIDDSRHWREFL